VTLDDIAPDIRDLVGLQDKYVQQQWNKLNPYDLAQEFKKEAANLTSKFNTTTGNATKAAQYTKIANEIEKKIYDQIDPQQVTNLFANTADEFAARADDALAAGNKKLSTAYNKLAEEIKASPKTIAAYRSFKKDFVDVSKIAKKTAEAAGGASLNSPGAGGGVFGKAIGGTIDTVLQAPTNRITQGIGQLTRAVGKGFQNGTAQKVLAGAGILGGGLLALNGLNNNNQATSSAGYNYGLGTTGTGATGLAGTLANSGGTADALNSLTTGNYASPYAQQAYVVAEPSLGGYTMTDYGNAWVAALQAGDTTMAKQYQAIYEMLAEQQAAQQEAATATTSSATQTKITDKQRQAYAAAQALEELAQMNPDLGTQLSQLPIVGGFLDTVQGGNIYNARAQSLAAQLGYMQSGANITPAEAIRIGQAYVPSAYDSAATREDKLRRAAQIIAQYQQSYVPDETSTLYSY